MAFCSSKNVHEFSVVSHKSNKYFFHKGYHGRNTVMGICFPRKKVLKTIVNKNINSHINSDTFHF